MNIIKRPTKITKDEILNKVDSWNIFRFYIGEFTVGRAFCSVFRKDDSPSMSIFLGKDEILRYIDHGAPEFSGDCFQLVEQMFNLDFNSALQKIASDFNLISSDTDYKRIISSYVKPILSPKRYSFIQVKTKKFSSKDLEYWNRHLISPTALQRDDVYSVKELYLNRKRQPIDRQEMCFAYYYPEGFKIYFPERPKGFRWLSNIPLTLIEDVKKIDTCEKITITKSKKDKLFLQNLLPCIISVQNESISAFKPEIVEKLKGKEVWVNYDADKAGKKASIAVTTLLGCKHLNIPDYLLEEGITDFAQWYYQKQDIKVIQDFLKLKGVI